MVLGWRVIRVELACILVSVQSLPDTLPVGSGLSNTQLSPHSRYLSEDSQRQPDSQTDAQQPHSYDNPGDRAAYWSLRLTLRAFFRHSANTSAEVILAAISTPIGATTISSNSPTPGMKSGIGSVGLNTYPTKRAANTLAYQGVHGCLYARYRVHFSLFSRWARRFHAWIIIH